MANDHLITQTLADALREVNDRESAEFRREFNGKRPPFFNEAEVPGGLVVDARPDDELWQYLENAIPLKPGGFDFGRFHMANVLGDIRKQHGDDVFLVLATGEHAGEWAFAPVIPEDLRKTPDVLFDQARGLVSQDHDRAIMMRQAYFATTRLGERELDYAFRELLENYPIQT